MNNNKSVIYIGTDPRKHGWKHTLSYGMTGEVIGVAGNAYACYFHGVDMPFILPARYLYFPR